LPACFGFGAGAGAACAGNVEAPGCSASVHLAFFLGATCLRGCATLGMAGVARAALHAISSSLPVQYPTYLQKVAHGQLWPWMLLGGCMASVSLLVIINDHLLATLGVGTVVVVPAVLPATLGCMVDGPAMFPATCTEVARGIG
jgi:hypothetical protein